MRKGKTSQQEKSREARIHLLQTKKSKSANLCSALKLCNRDESLLQSLEAALQELKEETQRASKSQYPLVSALELHVEMSDQHKYFTPSSLEAQNNFCLRSYGN